MFWSMVAGLSWFKRSLIGPELVISWFWATQTELFSSIKTFPAQWFTESSQPGNQAHVLSTLWKNYWWAENIGQSFIDLYWDILLKLKCKTAVCFLLHSWLHCSLQLNLWTNYASWCSIYLCLCDYIFVQNDHDEPFNVYCAALIKLCR